MGSHGSQSRVGLIRLPGRVAPESQSFCACLLDVRYSIHCASAKHEECVSGIRGLVGAAELGKTFAAISVDRQAIKSTWLLALSCFQFLIHCIATVQHVHNFRESSVFPHFVGGCGFWCESVRGVAGGCIPRLSPASSPFPAADGFLQQHRVGHLPNSVHKCRPEG